MPFKQPVSVLVLIHTPELDVLLLERAANPGFWQSVTGSREMDDPLLDTALREVQEETGIIAGATTPLRMIDQHITNHFEIFTEWRYRYAPGVTQNTEHLFSLEVPRSQVITVAPDEHLGYEWLPWQEAAKKVFSWSNRDAILMLPELRARRASSGT